MRPSDPAQWTTWGVVWYLAAGQLHYMKQQAKSRLSGVRKGTDRWVCDCMDCEAIRSVYGK